MIRSIIGRQEGTQMIDLLEARRDGLLATPAGGQGHGVVESE